jgi:hypothetical protein
MVARMFDLGDPAPGVAGVLVAGQQVGVRLPVLQRGEPAAGDAVGGDRVGAVRVVLPGDLAAGVEREDRLSAVREQSWTT